MRLDARMRCAVFAFLRAAEALSRTSPRRLNTEVRVVECARQRPAQRVGKRACYRAFMMNSHEEVASLSSSDLLENTRELVGRSRRLEAVLLVHLGEIDERKLYLELGFPSMFAFCVAEYGFSEEAAYNRILVARAGRRLPAAVEALRAGSARSTSAMADVARSPLRTVAGAQRRAAWNSIMSTVSR